MKFAFVGLAVAGLFLSGPTVAEGCGDTIASLLMGVRFQRAYNASRRASVIVFSNNGPSGAALTNPKLHATLREVGHTVVVVRDSTQLDLALRAGRVDVVLADFTDAGSIARELGSALDKPVIVPVLYKLSRTDSAAAQKQYPFALKASANEIQFLTAIADAMKLRAKF